MLSLYVLCVIVLSAECVLGYSDSGWIGLPEPNSGIRNDVSSMQAMLIDLQAAANPLTSSSSYKNDPNVYNFGRAKTIRDASGDSLEVIQPVPTANIANHVKFVPRGSYHSTALNVPNVGMTYQQKYAQDPAEIDFIGSSNTVQHTSGHNYDDKFHQTKNSNSVREAVLYNTRNGRELFYPGERNSMENGSSSGHRKQFKSLPSGAAGSTNEGTNDKIKYNRMSTDVEIVKAVSPPLPNFPTDYNRILQQSVEAPTYGSNIGQSFQPVLGNNYNKAWSSGYEYDNRLSQGDDRNNVNWVLSHMTPFSNAAADTYRGYSHDQGLYQLGVGNNVNQPPNNLLYQYGTTNGIGEGLGYPNNDYNQMWCLPTSRSPMNGVIGVVIPQHLAGMSANRGSGEGYNYNRGLYQPEVMDNGNGLLKSMIPQSAVAKYIPGQFDNTGWYPQRTANHANGVVNNFLPRANAAMNIGGSDGYNHNLQWYQSGATKGLNELPTTTGPQSDVAINSELSNNVQSASDNRAPEFEIVKSVNWELNDTTTNQGESHFGTGNTRDNNLFSQTGVDNFNVGTASKYNNNYNREFPHSKSPSNINEPNIALRNTLRHSGVVSSSEINNVVPQSNPANSVGLDYLYTLPQFRDVNKMNRGMSMNTYNPWMVQSPLARLLTGTSGYNVIMIQ